MKIHIRKQDKMDRVGWIIVKVSLWYFGFQVLRAIAEGRIG